MNKIKKMKIALFSIFSLFLLSIMYLVPSKAGFFCGGLGTSGMTGKTFSPVLLYDNANLRSVQSRKYTIMELFGEDSALFSIPFGETDGDWLIRKENHTVSEAVTSVFGESLSEEQTKRLEALGESGGCVFAGFLPMFQNASQEFIKTGTVYIRVLMQVFFDNTFICGEGGIPGQNCGIDLIGIAGGSKDGSGGVIGSLSRGLFVPMASLAFLFVAGYMIWQGAVKKQLRASFSGLLWGLFVFALGIFAMVRPWIVARAPSVAINTISGCVLNVMSGGSCFGNGTAEESYDDACSAYSNVPVTQNQSTKLTLSAMGCKITKSFLIDRWANQQFGYTFDELYTKVGPENSHITVYPAEKLHGKPEDYCVNLYSSNSVEDFITNRKVETNDTKQVCNIAAAWMADGIKGDFGNKATRATIVATAAKDDRMWFSMTGNGRDVFGVSAVLSVIAITISFIPVVFIGLTYSIIATIMMMFAPVFLLLGIHPGKGKKLFLGWLESVVSTVLKYFATAVFLLVMLIIYSSVFSTVRGGMVLISSIVLAVAFLSYRKEIVNMIGQSNLGGTKIANRADTFMNKLQKPVQSVGQLGLATAGGMIGGAIAGDTTEGVKQGALSHLRRGRGFVANATRSSEQVSQLKKKDRDRRNRELQQEAHRQKVLESIERTSQTIGQRIDDNSEQDYRGNAIENITTTARNMRNDVIAGEVLELQDSIESAPREDLVDTVDNVVYKVNIARELDDEIKNAGDNVSVGVTNFLENIKANSNEDIQNMANNIEDDLERAKYISDSEEQVEQTIKNINNYISYNENLNELQNVDLESIYDKLQELDNKIKNHDILTKASTIDDSEDSEYDDYENW